MNGAITGSVGCCAEEGALGAAVYRDGDADSDFLAEKDFSDRIASANHKKRPSRPSSISIFPNSL